MRIPSWLSIFSLLTFVLFFGFGYSDQRFAVCAIRFLPLLPFQVWLAAQPGRAVKTKPPVRNNAKAFRCKRRELMFSKAHSVLPFKAQTPRKRGQGETAEGQDGSRAAAGYRSSFAGITPNKSPAS